MPQPLNPRRQRIKLVALIAVFAAPVMVAWGMVEWRIGIPEQRTAHGELEPDVPPLAEWPLQSAREIDQSGQWRASDEASGDGSPGDWTLAFDCSEACGTLADQWWRLHRALGREASRVTRLRIGGNIEPLPGEAVAEWSASPAWLSPGRLWVLDPMGNAVLTYARQVEAGDVLDDVDKLLSMNPKR